jgi:hypothetical protein
MRRTPLLFAALLLAGPASAAELRAGVQFAGHLLFTDVAAVEVQWPALTRPDSHFLREIDLQTGLALSFDGEFLEFPAVVRIELLHGEWVGFELAPGLLVSHFRGTSALTPLICAGLPVTVGRVRVQPELCGNMTVQPGEPSYRGGLWTGLGLGVFYAF